MTTLEEIEVIEKEIVIVIEKLKIATPYGVDYTAAFNKRLLGLQGRLHHLKTTYIFDELIKKETTEKIYF